MRRRRVAFGVSGLLVSLVAAGGAAAGLSQASRANRSETARDAGKQLAALSLPPGATALQNRRSIALLERSLAGMNAGERPKG